MQFGKATRASGTHHPTLLVAVMFLFVASIVYVTEWRLMRQLEATELESYTGPDGNDMTIAKSVLQPCAPRPLTNDIFKSQDKEDKIIMNLFGIHERMHKCNGRYLEMGGLDGVMFSNSYAFRHGLDWKGVLVEASPDNFQELRKNRPNELATVHAGVCNQERDLHWIKGKMGAVGGFYEFADAGFRKRWWNQDDIDNSQVIRCRKLNNILNDAVGPGPFHFDFFSLDVEGAELDVLQSLDFDEYSFGIVLVECDEWDAVKNMAVRTILEANGYTFFMDKSRSWWFVNRQWHEIYNDVINADKDYNSNTQAASS